MLKLITIIGTIGQAGWSHTICIAIGFLINYLHKVFMKDVFTGTYYPYNI